MHINLFLVIVLLTLLEFIFVDYSLPLEIIIITIEKIGECNIKVAMDYGKLGNVIWWRSSGTFYIYK